MNYREQLYENYFDTQAGRAFAHLKERLESDRKQLSQDILQRMPADKECQILDFGCGFGSLIIFLKENGFYNIAGIDLSPEQVEVAHKLGLQEVQEANVFDFLSNKANAFDVITGIDIIEHFTKDEFLKLLKTLRQSLKPGGKVLFRTCNMDAPIPGFYPFGDFTHELLLNKQSAIQVMKVAGFDQVKVYPSPNVGAGGLKGLIQKILWQWVKLNSNIVMFASGRSISGVVLTPNMIIEGNVMNA